MRKNKPFEDSLDELTEIYDSHWIVENVNLGQYVTGFTCVCGGSWTHNGHREDEPSGDTLFFRHVAVWILNVGYRKEMTNE